MALLSWLLGLVQRPILCHSRLQYRGQVVKSTCPQIDWEVSQPRRLICVCQMYLTTKFNRYKCPAAAYGCSTQMLEWLSSPYWDSSDTPRLHFCCFKALLLVKRHQQCLAWKKSNFTEKRRVFIYMYDEWQINRLRSFGCAAVTLHCPCQFREGLGA